MTETWAGNYTGIPYSVADCWALARKVLREVFGKDMPTFEHPVEDAREFAAVVSESLPLADVDKVNDPRSGDIVLMRIAGQPCHIGVVCGTAGDRNMLHTLRGHDSALDRYDGTRWGARVEGFYRAR